MTRSPLVHGSAWTTLTTLGMALLLAGCAPALRQAPADAAVTVPGAWAQTEAAATSGPEAAVPAAWWQAFGDEQLNHYVQAALARNANLQVAGTRVAAARAQLAAANAALQPNLSLGANVGATHTLTASGITTSRSVQPQLQASWEPDLWGRLGDRSSAADLQYRASRADRDAVALTVAATTAQAYVDLLGREAQLAQTRQTLQTRSTALQLARDQESVGYISRLQVTQAQAEYEAVQGQIPPLELAIARQYNALQLLAGDVPAVRDTKAADGQGFARLQMPVVPAALPSALLRRRPDLVQAELNLAASDASLRASRAAYLPQLNLSASAGRLFVNALQYNPINVWSLGASVLAPLFDGGRLDAQYDTATAQRDQAAYAYRGAVLSALGDVENALVGVQRLAEQEQAAERRRAVLAQTLGYAKDRYEAGYASYLEQIDAQRNLFQAETELVNLRQSRLDNQIALYRALGGGWSADAVLPTAAAQAAAAD
ncbi:efflux transporter outer membrane subunit [Comamonas koreensis]|uniref:Efflux transporter outer membrane subunit n=1 Tax=Comamonas koreensis TaxID=160825 RepID=A0AAW4XVM2_9BURK|nr:efflux transporter outer membrane subunit [Comamonas koreensis]MCD2165165.1 efflux transporter outer membrane subunit [Comamonas koreensis]